MALQLRYQVQLTDDTFPYGYARIVSFNLTDSSATFALAIYAGRAARELGCDPLKERSIILTEDEVQRLRKEILACMYRILKEHPEYNGMAEV